MLRADVHSLAEKYELKRTEEKATRRRLEFIGPPAPDFHWLTATWVLIVLLVAWAAPCFWSRPMQRRFRKLAPSKKIQAELEQAKEAAEAGAKRKAGVWPQRRNMFYGWVPAQPVGTAWRADQRSHSESGMCGRRASNRNIVSIGKARIHATSAPSGSSAESTF